MRRIKFFTARLKPPYEWRILWVRMGVLSGGIALGGFICLFILQYMGMQSVGGAVCAGMVVLAWLLARWLTAMTPPRPGLALREGTQLGLLHSRIANPEWSNNREWPSPIASRVGNMVILKNGDIWVNYLLEGINFTSHRLNSIESCQKLNASLFSSLSQLAFIREVHVIGVKVRVRPETLTRRCIDQVPEWAKYESTLYRDAAKALTHFNNQYVTGQRKSFERPFWLAVKVGSTDQKQYERLLDSVGLAPSWAGISLQEAQRRERDLWSCLPAEFRALRTLPDDLDWMLERAALRALIVPSLPSRHNDKTMVAGNRNFRPVTITTGHEADALADMFVAAVAEQAGAKAGRLRRIFRDGVFHRYRSLRKESSIAVHCPGTRTPDFPDGLTSYQTMLTLASGPSIEGSVAIHKMSGIVDGFHGLDADVSFRVTFSPLPGDSAAGKLAKAQRRNDADDAALSRSEFDAAEYAAVDAQFRDVYDYARSENMLANVHVTFAFADANHHQLEQKLNKVIGEMADDGFQLFRHVGAQVQQWRNMLPCTAASGVIEDTRLTQTPALLGAVMPIRRQTLGDPYGWPIGVNLENALGQVVYIDVLTGTEGGDGSILMFGEQGTGKSTFYKNIASAVHDLQGEVWSVDPTGEMEVFASAFADPERPSPGDPIIVDLVRPEISLDLLKCLPPDEATAPWLDVWCPLLGVNLNSAEYERLATVIAPGYRSMHRSPVSGAVGLATTRQVFEHIAAQNDAVAVTLRRSFNAIKDMPAAACLVDPIDLFSGTVRNLPAINASESRFVVFNTRQYLLRDGDTATATSSRLATGVFTAIAALAKFYFDRSGRVNLFCIDEAHTLDAPIIKRNILSDTNKQGRKFKNIVMASSQTVGSLGTGLELATRRAGFRQRASENAIPVLQQVHIAPTPEAVRIMTTDLSPAAPNSHLPEAGREGELFWFDGRNPGKMQTFLPFIPERTRLADTRPGTIIRVDEHRANRRARHRVG